MKLLNGNILIRVDNEQTETNGGILLQSGTVRLPSTGVVENISDGIDGINIGDRVEFLRYAAIDGIEPDTRICKLEHIVGVYGPQGT